MVQRIGEVGFLKWNGKFLFIWIWSEKIRDLFLDALINALAFGRRKAAVLNKKFFCTGLNDRRT